MRPECLAVPNPKKTGYRVVAVSLYEREAAEADRITDILKEAGWHKANRSLVIREALAHLQEELTDRSPDDIFRYFIDRHARRAAKPRKSVKEEPIADVDHHSTKTLTACFHAGHRLRLGSRIRRRSGTHR
jgi:hypothetical protein